MLRECRRVLKPEGWVAAIVIETAEGLSGAERAAAAELGPSDVGAEAPLDELCAMAGLEPVEVDDLTADYARVVAALLDGLRTGEAELRATEGDDEYEHEVSRRTGMLEAIERGLIRRTYVLARRRLAPAGRG